nr:purine-nucleoside phosphorylase [Lachnoclostridium phytofermentans]
MVIIMNKNSRNHSAYERLLKCYESFQKKINFKPLVALVLGSGLGDYADQIKVEATLDYNEIEGFPVSTVAGHKGRFVFGYVEEVPVVIMQGRVHYYEGYEMEDVVLPTRLMKMMGAKVLFLTNAAGGVNYNFNVGDFMLITDQISNFVPSPLIGPNIEELGLRFCDMSEVYDKDLREVIRNSAKEINLQLQEGVYIQLSGPNFETPAEVKMCRLLGADAVGMSTACEAIAANHMGMKICGISCISNLGCGMTEEPLSHTEVQETADRVAPLFKQLITTSIRKISELIDAK